MKNPRNFSLNSSLQPIDGFIIRIKSHVRLSLRFDYDYNLCYHFTISPKFSLGVSWNGSQTLIILIHCHRQIEHSLSKYGFYIAFVILLIFCSLQQLPICYEEYIFNNAG
jgi:hypothetical protein